MSSGRPLFRRANLELGRGRGPGLALIESSVRRFPLRNRVRHLIEMTLGSGRKRMRVFVHIDSRAFPDS